MTNAEARALHKGMFVASPHSTPAYRIRKLAEDPWVSEDLSIVRLLIVGNAGAWVPPDDYMAAPGPETAFTWSISKHMFVSRYAEREHHHA